MKLAVVSTMTGLAWGASEELWSRAALHLLGRGHALAVSVDGGSGAAPRLERLRERGARVHRRSTPGGHRWNRRWKRLLEVMPAAAIPASLARPTRGRQEGWNDPSRWRAWLRRESPDLVLVSLGSHLDDPAAALACAGEGLPYALLLHSADPGRWIEGADVPRFRRAWSDACAGFFVSAETRRLLERQLAVDLPPSRVVANPLAVRPDGPLPWPSTGTDAGDGQLHLACVGRLGCWQKGQDLVVDVLARQPWRRRPLRLTFWGGDHGNRRQLLDLVRRRGLADRIRFAGHTPTPLEIWRRCHGLLLPSRYEGMPMVTAEAMLCGRVPVVTDCGRNGEWVEDGVTGFLAPAATPDLVDEALERAWQERARWPAIGRRAAERLRRDYEPGPDATFAAALESL